MKQNILTLNSIVLCWFFAEIISHRNKDYEKTKGLPLDGESKDYIFDAIKEFVPSSDKPIVMQFEHPFDYGLIVNTPSHVFLPFGGTDGFDDWLNNADMFPFIRGMHHGWWTSNKRFHPLIKEYSKSFVGKKVYTTGQSQGGPHALYTSRYLAEDLHIMSTCNSYESPVAGNDEFCVVMNDLGIVHNRVWTRGDPVVMYFQNVGKHYGNSIELPESWLHNIPIIRTYLHGYRMTTKQMMVFCKQRKMIDEYNFLKNQMLPFVTI
jgi:hypothetical protein